jgi:hypothetical protein
MQAEFCHIAPTPHLNLVEGRPVHLVLAHLIEEDSAYVDFYLEQKEKYNCKIIMDNSAFEMYKQGRDMYPSEKLLQMGTSIKADWIVMSDYPNEPSEKTIEAAKKLAPEFHDAGFGTFFVPQSKIGDVRDCTDAFMWAANNPDIVDYIGVSILTAPNCYGVERGNKLQRFVSRLCLMYEMDQTNTFHSFKKNGQRVHFLGMVDGPNEIMYMSPWKGLINTWDSSAAVWAGLNGIKFDLTPTGMVDGKFEEEVDFNFKTDDNEKITLVKENMDYIDRLVYGHLYDGSDLRPWEKKR